MLTKTGPTGSTTVIYGSNVVTAVATRILDQAFNVSVEDYELLLQIANRSTEKAENPIIPRNAWTKMTTTTHRTGDHRFD